MPRWLRVLVCFWLLASATTAGAHPFLDVQPVPLPPPTVELGAEYTVALTLYPGDTPVQSVQLDFELSSAFAFGAPTGELGDGFALLYDPLADPLHFSVVGDFTGDPLAAFGVFPVAELTLLAQVPGTLSLLDSSVVVALEAGVPEVFELDHISNVQDNVIVIAVPEPSGGLLLACGLAALVALAQRRRARA